MQKSLSWVKLERAGEKAISVSITPELSKLCKKMGVNFAGTAREAVVKKIKKTMREYECEPMPRTKKGKAAG